MRVANYYRVSTKLQQDRFSLAAQEYELRAFNKRMGWKLVAEFVDVESGGKLDKAGLKQLLDLVEQVTLDCVAVMDQDRLSRLDTVSWEYLKSVLRENSVKIAEPNGTVTDLGNEDDEFMSDLKNLLAQREKKKVVKRMMYGKRQRLREGKGWGVCPFEYYYENDTYHVKDGWAWTIPLIDDLYLNKRYGYTKIANELNSISKTPTGNSWNEHLIHTRLASKCFHGFQEMEFANGETISAGVYEPLRTEETYNKIQEVRKERREQFSVATRTSTKNIGLLKYVPLTCGHCGRVLFVNQTGSKSSPVYGTMHGRAKSIKSGLTCDLYINAKRYEYNLVVALKEILSGEELSRKYIDFKTSDKELQLLEFDLKKFRKELDKYSISKDKLLDLYLSSDDMNKEVYQEKEIELSKKINVTSDLVSKTERKIAAINKDEWNYESLTEYMKIADDVGVKLNRHEQAGLLANLFTKGVLTEDVLVLTTEMYNGIPVEIKIPVEDCTRRVNKWIRRDERNGDVVYRY